MCRRRLAWSFADVSIEGVRRLVSRKPFGRKQERWRTSTIICMRITRVRGVLLMVMMAGGGLLAQEHSAKRNQKRERVFRVLTTQLGEVDSQLEQEDQKGALKGARNLLTKAYRPPVRGPGAADFLAAVHLRIAIAAMGVDPDEASWHYQTARILASGVVEVDIARFEDAEKFFDKIDSQDRPRGKELLAPESDNGSPTEEFPPGFEVRRVELTPPKQVRNSVPRVRSLGKKARVELEVVIDRNGDLKSPRLLSTNADPVLVSAVLDALRQWRYRPARVGSRPVMVSYRVTLSL